MRLPPRITLALAVVSCAACRSTPLSDVGESLRRGDWRTVAVEPEFTLFSPYDAERTGELTEIVDRNLRAMEAMFDVSFEEPILVLARPLDIDPFMRLEGDTLTITHVPSAPSRHGTLGYAGILEGNRTGFVFYVARDRDLEGQDGVLWIGRTTFDYEAVVRHELAHVCAGRLDLWGPRWFSEGFAEELEHTQLEDGRLEPIESPLTIRLAAQVRDRFTLQDLLDWEEDGFAISEGEEEVFQEGRPLSHAYFRFLIERSGRERSAETYRSFLEMSRDEHLALEADWKAWLAARAED